MKSWWKWFYTSFIMLITFTIFQFQFLTWLTRESLDTFYLSGWVISLLFAVGLLIYQWKEERNIEEIKKENERLKEAVEYYRHKAE
ncbi:hypothetical protein FZC78_11150 [Rossellomorea vietnamensis]|uniref:Uncharacterized protein n=1 Tax=Rossellomorea vietnamensis TaxID=218284 RepID=A0A5D4NTF7_9BACI|nr:hypothetical protein [Rossellomorea vietnamensis]TYS17159.1 hypothetical protein FZC78_11150 [Rossellomorea vietnamensis]